MSKPAFRVALAVVALALATWLLLGTAVVKSANPAVQPPATLMTTSGNDGALDARDAASRTAPAQPGEQRERAALAAQLELHWQRVAREGHPRQRVLALWALLARRPTDLALRRKARSEAARLLAASPDDELLASAQTWFCDPPPHGCPASAVDAWARTAPGNAAAWVEPMRAMGADGAALDALLARAASAQRYDSMMQAQTVETVAALDGLALPPAGPNERRWLRESGFEPTEAERRRFLAATEVFALPTPYFGTTSRACRPPLSPARAANCRAIYRRMAQLATSMIERNVAYAALARLTAGTPEGAYWSRERRRLQWWLYRFASLTTGAVYWEDFLRHGEYEAVRRALPRAGIPLEPPAGWRPG